MIPRIHTPSIVTAPAEANLIPVTGVSQPSFATSPHTYQTALRLISEKAGYTHTAFSRYAYFSPTFMDYLANA